MNFMKHYIFTLLNYLLSSLLGNFFAREQSRPINKRFNIAKIRWFRFPLLFGAQIRGRSVAGIVGSNPAEGMDIRL